MPRELICWSMWKKSGGRVGGMEGERDRVKEGGGREGGM